MTRKTPFLATVWVLATCNSVVLGRQEPTPAEIESADRVEVDQATGVEFREPFSPISARNSQSKLIVFLISDDDPIRWASRTDSGESEHLDLSCGPDFRMALRKTVEMRRDLKERLVVQRVAAGLPVELTGGARPALPSRCIVAICDGQYRLLNLSVGVPDGSELINQIEDAEECKTLLRLGDGSPKKMGAAIMERGDKRMRRIYREALDKILETVTWDESFHVIDEPWLNRFAELSSALQPVYLVDAKLRFGLTDPSDQVRLLVLEQHCETRHDWCQAISPFVLGRSMESLLRPLVESIWDRPAVINTSPADFRQAIQLFQDQRENAVQVFAIQPPLSRRLIAWPPPDVSLRKSRMRDWNALEKVLAKHIIKSVHAEELAILITEAELEPIDLIRPAALRYVVFEPGKRMPLLIRETDLPGKITRRLESK